MKGRQKEIVNSVRNRKLETKKKKERNRFHDKDKVRKKERKNSFHDREKVRQI